MSEKNIELKLCDACVRMAKLVCTRFWVYDRQFTSAKPVCLCSAGECVFIIICAKLIYFPLGFLDEFLIDVTVTLTRLLALPLFFNKFSLLFCEWKTGILDGLVRTFDVGVVGVAVGVAGALFRIGTGISELWLRSKFDRI